MEEFDLIIMNGTVCIPFNSVTNVYRAATVFALLDKLNFTIKILITTF